MCGAPPSPSLCPNKLLRLHSSVCSAACVANDLPLTADEAQLWALLSDFDDDVEPETHACRLRLSLATRTCPAMGCPWSPTEQLALYHAKLPLIPASCQLCAADELLLLRAHAANTREMGARTSFLEASLAAEHDANAADANAAAANPFAAGASATPQVPSLTASYPPRPSFSDFDGPLEPTVLLQPEALAAWQKKLGSLSYSRPEEVSGLAAMKTLADWIGSGMRIDADSRGFWLLYELLTGSISVRILLDDSPHNLGSLLLRLASAGISPYLPVSPRISPYLRSCCSASPLRATVGATHSA